MTEQLAQTDQLINQGANPTDVIADATQEKLVPQSKVNDLISKGYHQGYQKALQENPQQAPAQSSVSGLSVEEMNKHINAQLEHRLTAIQQETLRTQQEVEGKRILDELEARMLEAKTRIPDYEDTVKQAQFGKHAAVLHYAHQAGDLSGDVLYELAKNPSKITLLEQSQPHIAALEIKRLADSIRMNQAGANTKLPPAPLGQLQPSNIGISKGPKTASDFRNAYRGRL